MNDVGFLGLGKMGTSILKGILLKSLYKKEKIGFYAPSDKTKEKGINFGINLAKDESDLFKNSKIIILAIEPQKYQEVFSKLKDIDFKDKIIISLAPGKTIDYLKGVFKEAKIARAMPNTPSVINCSVTTIAFGDGEIKEVVDIFSSIGEYFLVKEDEIDKAIPLHGSMPAYIFEFVREFTIEAKHFGLDKDEATKLALNAIIGSCELALKSGEELDVLIESVCSKGGSTIAGLNELRNNGFSEAIKKCYDACVKRSIELKDN